MCWCLICDKWRICLPPVVIQLTISTTVANLSLNRALTQIFHMNVAVSWMFAEFFAILEFTVHQDRRLLSSGHISSLTWIPSQGKFEWTRCRFKWWGGSGRERESQVLDRVNEGRQIIDMKLMEDALLLVILHPRLQGRIPSGWLATEKQNFIKRDVSEFFRCGSKQRHLS